MACVDQQLVMRKSSFMPGHAAETTSQQQIRIQLLSVLWHPVNMQALCTEVKQLSDDHVYALDR